MYATSTHELMLAMDFDFLAPLPAFFLYIAFAAWPRIAAARAMSAGCAPVDCRVEVS